jgi:glycosyltransferase involved in cell wall biosynthesis
MKICFIERKHTETISIEKVFRQISKKLNEKGIKTSFIKLPFGNSFKEIVKNLLFFRIAHSSADIFHITGHVHYIALVLPKNKTVLTVHDLNILYKTKGLRRYLIKKLAFDLPFKKLKYITVISEATKSEILKLTKCDQNKIRVIHNPTFENNLNLAIKLFNNGCPTILQVGTAPQKNLKTLIPALKTIECHLRIIGKLDVEIVDLLRVNKINYSNAFDLSNSEIETEYNNADIVAFCSTYEGFGLPILEGQMAGKPLITSNISPMKDIAGNAAYLANPFDFMSIRSGVLKIIEDSDYRHNLISNGFKNIKRFDPSNIADEYMKLYDTIIHND